MPDPDWKVNNIGEQWFVGDTVNLAIGYITPPYGATLFVACGISEQSVRAVSGQVVPILIAMLVVLVVVTYWPDTVLWLPRLAAP